MRGEEGRGGEMRGDDGRRTLRPRNSPSPSRSCASTW